MVHIDGSEIAAAREGKSSNAKTQAALTFALKVVAKKGEVSADDVANVNLQALMMPALPKLSHMSG